jgi:O-methyltransferase
MIHMKKIKTLFYYMLRLLSGIMHNKFFYLQFRMETGSKTFFGKKEQQKRKIVPFSTWDTVRKDMLILALKDITDNNIPGELAELGVYKGHSARLIHHYIPERMLFLFDTFSGFDENDIKIEKTFHGDKYDQFRDTNVKSVMQLIDPENDNVVPIVGMFPQSVPAFFDHKFAFVHMDMDLYQPTLEAFRYFYDRVSRGGYMIVHDYSNIKWPGIKKAVDEFFLDKSERPVLMPDNGGSALIRKI